jgi:multicomponent Na+:H+ antiporter subunit E
MIWLLGNILLALAWLLITDDFSTTSLLIGLVLGYGVLWLMRPAMKESRYLTKVPTVVRFSLYFLKELWIANLRMVYHVITPHETMSPGVVAVPLEEASDVELTLLANFITLTPGTLSVDISEDRRFLYVHAVDCQDPDEVRREIKDGFERRILELMR